MNNKRFKNFLNYDMGIPKRYHSKVGKLIMGVHISKETILYFSVTRAMI